MLFLLKHKEEHKSNIEHQCQHRGVLANGETLLMTKMSILLVWENNNNHFVVSFLVQQFSCPYESLVDDKNVDITSCGKTTTITLLLLFLYYHSLVLIEARMLRFCLDEEAIARQIQCVA